MKMYCVECAKQIDTMNTMVVTSKKSKNDTWKVSSAE